MLSIQRATRPRPQDPYYSVPDDVPPELVSIGREVSRLEESARWSSQGQFEQSKFWRGCNLALGVPASILGLASGGAVLTDFAPDWLVGGVALVGASLAGTMTILGAERRSDRAHGCANAFHDIQSDARRFLLVDLKTMNLEEARTHLQALTERYAEIRRTADAPAKRFYKRAGKNLRAGGQSFGIDAEAGPSATHPKSSTASVGHVSTSAHPTALPAVSSTNHSAPPTQPQPRTAPAKEH